MVMILCFSISI